MILTRLRRIGLLSLSTLFFGGLILILTGLNGLIGPNSIEGRSPGVNTIRLFNYGSHLGVQSWIAILGVGFGLISYGFNETYIHFFNWWCSRQAQSEDGLDYAAYLNSQPQAPVLYGRRGLTTLLTLRYFLILSSITASIAYKFGIVKPGVEYAGHIRQDDIWLVKPAFSRPTDETESPWFTDQSDSWARNRGFFHEAGELLDPPRSTIMVGTMRCGLGLLAPSSTGTIYTREFVIVANMTEENVKDKGAIVAGSTDEWIRTYIHDTGYLDDIGWFNSSQPGVVVEYHFSHIGELHVRWAKIEKSAIPFIKDKESAKTIKGEKWPVEHYVKYTMRHAVAEVGRQVNSPDCSRLSSVQVLSIDDNPPKGISKGEISFLIPPEWIFAQPMLEAWGEHTQDGIGIILQVAMTIISGTLELLDRSYFNPDYPFAHFVPEGTYPFGPEITVDVESRRSPDHPSNEFAYPYLDANGWTAAGIITYAAYGFIGIGCFSILVALIRIYIGVPFLTSWMGQHVFFAQSGAVSIHQGELANGYIAAKVGLGRLKLRME